MTVSFPRCVLVLVALSCGRRPLTEPGNGRRDPTDPHASAAAPTATIGEGTDAAPDAGESPPAVHDPRVSTWLEHVRPSEAEAVRHSVWHHAANSSEVEWRVFLEEEEVRAVRFNRRDPPAGEHPPFAGTIPARGRTRYARVDDGWLAASNRGEFGAQLDWYSPDGKQTYEVSDAQVVAFFSMHSALYAVEGLSHLGSSRGSVVRIDRGGADKRWSARTVAPLPSAPLAVAQRRDGTVLVTLSDALVTFARDRTVTKVLETTAWFDLYPTSSVLTPDERKLYLGMRQFVLEIDLGTHAMRFLIPAKEFLHQLSREEIESIRRQHSN